MTLTVWIAEPQPLAAEQLQAAWQEVAGSQALLYTFSALPLPCAAPAPDLFMAELQNQCDQVTDLLLTLRQSRSTDFLPVTCDTSASSFTRAQQLGAIDYILKPFTMRRLRQSLRRYLTLKQSLSAASALTQTELDRFFFSGHCRKKLMLPALSEAERVSCKHMLSALLHAPDRRATALEAAQLLGISRVTARKYLELLTAAGYVKKHAIYGAAGRPQYLYQLCALDE